MWVRLGRMKVIQLMVQKFCTEFLWRTFPFFTPKNQEGHQKNPIVRAKYSLPNPSVFPRLLVFGLFFFRGFLNHGGMMIFPRGSPFVGWWARSWWGYLPLERFDTSQIGVGSFGRSFTQKSLRPTKKHHVVYTPWTFSEKSPSWKKENNLFPTMNFGIFCFYIHHLPTVKCFFQWHRNPLEKKQITPAGNPTDFFVADDSSSCVEPADWLRCVAWVEKKKHDTPLKSNGGNLKIHPFWKGNSHLNHPPPWLLGSKCWVSLEEVSPQDSPPARLRMSVTTDRMDGFGVYFLLKKQGSQGLTVWLIFFD